MLTAISPIDGRYHEKTKVLGEYFSEYALIKYRVFVEIQYFIALCQHPVPQLSHFDMDKVESLNEIFENFNLQDALEIIGSSPSRMSSLIPKTTVFIVSSTGGTAKTTRLAPFFI